MKIVIYAQELLSVALTPFVLWFSLPDCAPAIVDFFREFSIHVDSLGYVCSFAVFDFQRHGNVKVSPDHLLVPFSSISVVIFPPPPPFSPVDHHPKIYGLWLDLWGTRDTTLMDYMAIGVLMEEMGHGTSLAPEKLFSLNSSFRI